MQERYKIYTLGCKVNQQESEEIAKALDSMGFSPAGKDETADFYIINSCTVTSIADSKTRQRIRQARKRDADALICVIGCLPEVSNDKVVGMPEVDLTIGSADKERTVEIVHDALKKRAKARVIRMEAHSETTRSSTKTEKRTRAFIKVEDGCDRFCAYCIIPYARGGVRCKSASDVVAEAQSLIQAGYKEIVLTGINLALYKQDSVGLGDLVKRICEIDTDKEFRIRLGSLEPTVITEIDAVRLAEQKGVCPQFHLSLQSGCEKTLNAMGRPYSPVDFENIVKKLKKIDPLFSITTDVIVGFPGETDNDFEESLSFVKSIGFANVHVFKYSKRSGTIAAEMENQVPEEVKLLRSSLMSEVAARSKVEFLEKNTGKVRRTLILSTGKDSTGIRGLTDNGIDVILPAKSLEYRQNRFYDIPVNCSQ